MNYKTLWMFDNFMDADFSFVTISGRDSLTFLQRVVSADVSPLREERVVWSDLLTPQGRILFTFLIVPIGSGYWLSLPSHYCQGLYQALLGFVLKEQVSIATNSKMNTRFAKVSAQQSLEKPGLVEREARCVFFTDPRNYQLGRRVIYPKFELPPSTVYNEENAMPYEQYLFLSYQLGVVEETHISGERPFLPLEVGHHLFHAIDFDKGCFIGQEVNARLHRKAAAKRTVVGAFCPHPILENTSFPYVIASATITKARVIAGINYAQQGTPDKNWAGLILLEGTKIKDWEKSKELALFDCNISLNF